MHMLIDMPEDKEDVAGRVAMAKNMAKNKNKACATLITPPRTAIVHTLNFRVSPGFSFGKLFVLIIYAIFMLYTSLHHSNLFAADPMRTGYITMLQILIAVALTGKIN
ncbi:hypothetical protein F5148DRAFT_1296377 [Russula earlei]|uniref:Uncharacterized protein n=1 Tax=Russula earlei TaxID=71964 RepID=A0ACC0TQ57_9AGAM|nr:hypothetical protein F5148DRAFT_1296377 [Russula earlei]